MHFYFICTQVKINEEINTVLTEILTALLKHELLEGYTVDSSSDE